MRKEIVLPSLAVGGGIVGLILRRWELATAFEADTGLVTPNMPSTWALIIWSAVLAVVPLSLCSFMPLPAAMMLATVVLPTPEGP